MIEPVHGPVLKVRQRIVPGGSRQLVFAKHNLFLPGVKLVGRFIGRFSTDPISTLQCLSAVAPDRNSFRIDDLAFYVKAADQETVALILQVLKDRPRVLSHENGVRRIVVDPELITNTVLLAGPMQGDPRAW